MPALTIKPNPSRGPSLTRTATRWAAGLAAGATLAACGAAPIASASDTALTAGKTLTYYAFDVNDGSADPGFVPVPGTDPGDFAQGDELIINDQVTVTRENPRGYKIVGRDAGACTLTRIPAKSTDPVLANCVVTIAVPGGSLAVQGIVTFKARQPQPGELAITGGTGQFAAAAGSMWVSFTKDYKVLTIRLK